MVRRAISVFLATIALLPLGSCGGSSDAEQACVALDEAECEFAARCPENSDLIPFVYATLESCKARLPLECKSLTSLPGTGFTRAELDACSSDVAGAACDATQSTACAAIHRGSLAAGAGCTGGIQCRSGECALGVLPAECGHCAPLAEEGDACAKAVCDTGLTCDFTKNVCRPFAKEGQACGSVLCLFPLVCIDATCHAPLEAGDACKAASSDPCDFSKQLQCRSGKCVVVHTPPEVLPGIGEACQGGCVAGASCDETGHCKADPEDGASCVVDGPISCSPPATCVGGHCSLDAASCH